MVPSFGASSISAFTSTATATGHAPESISTTVHADLFLTIDDRKSSGRIQKTELECRRPVGESNRPFPPIIELVVGPHRSFVQAFKAATGIDCTEGYMLVVPSVRVQKALKKYTERHHRRRSRLFANPNPQTRRISRAWMERLSRRIAHRYGLLFCPRSSGCCWRRSVYRCGCL